jgi:hypothetical protein
MSSSIYLVIDIILKFLLGFKVGDQFIVMANLLYDRLLYVAPEYIIHCGPQQGDSYDKNSAKCNEHPQ